MLLACFLSWVTLSKDDWHLFWVQMDLFLIDVVALTKESKHKLLFAVGLLLQVYL